MNAAHRTCQSLKIYIYIDTHKWTNGTFMPSPRKEWQITKTRAHTLPISRLAHRIAKQIGVTVRPSKILCSGSTTKKKSERDLVEAF